MLLTQTENEKELLKIGICMFKNGGGPNNGITKQNIYRYIFNCVPQRMFCYILCNPE